jgi:hypothetical protein
MKAFWTATLIAALSAAGGCGGSIFGGRVALPKAFPADSEREQQRSAQKYDPYPQADVGPPVVGGRPLEYANPPAEVLRVQPRIGEPQFTPPPPSAPTW